MNIKEKIKEWFLNHPNQCKITLQCKECGKNFVAYKKKLFRKTRPEAGIFCSRQCLLKTWRDQSLQNKSTYAHIKINNKTYPAHRFIMEQTLERKLKPNEIVHHKNGKLKNNRPENLMVMDKIEHHKYHAKLSWSLGTFDHLSELHKGNKNPMWKGGKQELTCEHCGKKYRKYPDKRWPNRFCSKECKYSSSSWKNRIGQSNILSHQLKNGGEI